MTGSRPPLRWRIFAVFMLVSMLPYDVVGLLLVPPSVFDVACLAVNGVGIVGVTGYAFDRRIGSRLFWRAFAPVFIVFNVAVLLFGVTFVSASLTSFAQISNFPVALLYVAAVFAMMVMALTVAMSLALLRYGGWLVKTPPR